MLHIGFLQDCPDSDYAVWIIRDFMQRTIVKAVM